MRTLRVMGLTLAWVLSVCLVAGAGWVAIGLAGRRIGVVSQSAVAAPVPSGSESFAIDSHDQGPGLVTTPDGPGTSRASSPPPSATGRPAEAGTTGTTAGTAGTAGTAAGTGETGTTGGGRTTGPSSARGGSGGTASRRTTEQEKPAGRTTGRTTDTRQDEETSTSQAGSRTSESTRRSSRSSDTMRWGTYADRAGQIRVACTGRVIADWRVLPAVGWSARAVIVNSGEMWVVLFRESAGVAVRGTCPDGRPRLEPLDSDRALISVGGGETVVER
ncbi:MAG: hypothetical protein QG622_3366 [Actinomycetota bacterium]|nr:hypothetical protein [Actinomycetota bacterium]